MPAIRVVTARGQDGTVIQDAPTMGSRGFTERSQEDQSKHPFKSTKLRMGWRSVTGVLSSKRCQNMLKTWNDSGE
jgi:hypothetical protein